MWKAAPSLDKYEYVRTNPYRIRFIAFLGALATISMCYGFLQFIGIRPLYAFIFGPITAIIVINKFSRFVLQMFYPRFDIPKHEQFVTEFWKNNPEPAVDIFLPWAGEELDMHEQVVKGAALLNYKNVKIYMLDDKGSEEHKRLAEKYNCIYLSRPNKGEYKKSGNLEYGYGKSNGEFIFILDADFIPTRDSLHDLIPYLATEPEIGILQTPQYFDQSEDVHSRSKIEFGGGNIVEDFYKILMPCRDEFKAGMCVGTSAIYRRTVIQLLNGTPKVHASEDLATGLSITRFGYYVKYLPLIVSIGKSPDSFQGYFKQHQRWCSGNIVFARYWPRARLSLMGRLIYLTNPFYYLSEAMSVIFSYQFLFLLYFHHETLSLYNTLYFLPYVLVSRVLVPSSKTNKNKMGTRFAALNNTYTYFYTYLQMIFKGVPQWHPTGVKVKGLHPDYLNAFNLGTVISSVFIITFLFVIVSRPQVLGNYNAYPVLGWSLYSLAWHVLFLSFVAEYIHPYRLENIRSDLDKAFVYVKRHAVLTLFFVLLGSTVFSASLGLSDPSAPTIVAFNQLTGNANENSQMAMADTNAQEAILGTSTINYVIAVEDNDTLTSVAAKAIQTYLDDNQHSLDQSQIDASISLLLTRLGQIVLPPVGESISFEPQLLEETIYLSSKAE